MLCFSFSAQNVKERSLGRGEKTHRRLHQGLLTVIILEGHDMFSRNETKKERDVDIAKGRNGKSSVKTLRSPSQIFDYRILSSPITRTLRDRTASTIDSATHSPSSIFAWSPSALRVCTCRSTCRDGIINMCKKTNRKNTIILSRIRQVSIGDLGLSE